MKVTLQREDGKTIITSNLDGISYAIGVALRAGAPVGKGGWGSKISAIKHLREEKGYYLTEAIILIDFAWEMIKQCEGNKLPAMLNPID